MRQNQIRSRGAAPERGEGVLVGLLALAWGILGLMLGALILGLGAVAALGLVARVRWLRWRHRRSTSFSGTRVIDAEYRVLEDRGTPRPGGSHD